MNYPFKFNLICLNIITEALQASGGPPGLPFSSSEPRGYYFLGGAGGKTFDNSIIVIIFSQGISFLGVRGKECNNSIIVII